MSRHWKSFWFLADGWSSLMLFGACLTVAYLWRPRENNRTFGMDELADSDAVTLDEVRGDVERGQVGNGGKDGDWSEEGLRGI